MSSVYTILKIHDPGIQYEPRVKFQIAATNVPKLVEVYRFLHVDFRSSFGTVFQGVRRVLTLASEGCGDRAESTHFALKSKVEHGIAAYSTDVCHPIHRKVATQSTGSLPPNPREACHPVHGKAATQST